MKMPDQLTIEAWLKRAKIILAEQKCPTPELDARLLLGEATGLSSAGIISGSREPLNVEHLSRADTYLKRRAKGEPVHRILGWREFFGRKFDLSAETLIPRPDTETMIEAVLSRVQNASETIRILDIGTGSGAVAVTLAVELPGSQIVATDISQGALSTARGNAIRHGVENRIRFVLSDLFSDVGGQFDLIVSNPPYVPDDEIGFLEKEVRLHDPYPALAGGEDGLDFFRAIFREGHSHLAGCGGLFLEIGEGQSDRVCQLASENGYVAVEKFSDLSGIERVISARVR